MTSSYEIIFEKFLGKIKDYDFAKNSQEIAYEQMNEWLHMVIGSPFARKLFKEITWDDDKSELEFELVTSFDDTYDSDFVCEVFARGMVIQWLEPQEKTTTLTAQMFSGKEQKYFAQANHLSEIRKMLSKEKADWRRFIRDHKYADFAIKGGKNES